MTDARARRIQQAGFLAALGALVSTAAIGGCGDGATTGTSTGETTSSSTSTSTGTGGAGGTGSSSTSGSGMGGNAGPLASSPITKTGIVFDAAPDLNGGQAYITAVGPNGAGVFTAALNGTTATAQALQVGSPFVAPFGIAVSSDGTRLYVTDPGVSTAKEKGIIFTLPSVGGVPQQVAGSAESLPSGIAVVDESGTDVLYFTGADPADGARGVFSIPATGGIVKTIAKGNLLRSPSGITVAKGGNIYVCDTLTSNIVVIKGGTQSAFFKDPIKVNFPCGVAFSVDEKILYITGLDKKYLGDDIISADTVEALTMDSTKGLEKLSEIGGMHRAKNVNIFSFVDSPTAPNGGQVFVLK